MSKFAIEKVYVDTNILINYALGKEKVGKYEDFAIAKKVFEDAINGNYKIVISNFLLTETLHALRDIATRSAFKELVNVSSKGQLVKIINSKEFGERINKESYEAFTKIVDKLTKDQEHFLIESAHQPYSGEIFQNCLKTLTETFGYFRVFSYRCKRCNKYMKCNDCKTDSEIVYKGVNAPDLTHLFISLNLGCERFLTMDKSFSKISDRVPIKIEILG